MAQSDQALTSALSDVYEFCQEVITGDDYWTDWDVATGVRDIIVHLPRTPVIDDLLEACSGVLTGEYMLSDRESAEHFIGILDAWNV